MIEKESVRVAGMVDDHYSTPEHLDGIGIRRLGMELSAPTCIIQDIWGGRK